MTDVRPVRSAMHRQVCVQHQLRNAEIVSMTDSAVQVSVVMENRAVQNSVSPNAAMAVVLPMALVLPVVME